MAAKVKGATVVFDTRALCRTRLSDVLNQAEAETREPLIYSSTE